ncbi:MAG: polynucleotide adenylyltransferase PcnB [Desulfovibrio sp.]
MKKPKSKTVIYPRAKHSVSRQNIDEDALKVIYRLRRHRFTSYLVGGAVRDLLLGRQPKDFDVSTNASPRQIKRLFRNCFLIGRRFRLAHINFGGNIIETSTFRGEPKQKKNSEGTLYRLTDNTFGTPEEDAQRRDFTINGLFYDINGFQVIDHVGGVEDIKNKVIRAIGNPEVRFQEDPVRMLRAIRFASRLGFSIETRTWKAIVNNADEINNASAPRLLEELFRLFSYQCSKNNFKLLYESGVLHSFLLPIAEYIDRTGGMESVFWKYLEALDGCDRSCGEATPVIILGTIFYPLIMEAVASVEAEGGRPRIGEIVHSIIRPFALRFQMPKKIFFRLVMVFFGQARLAGTKKKFSRKRFVSQPSFAETLALYAVHLTAMDADRETLVPWVELFDIHGCKDDSDKKRSNSPSRAKGRRRKKRRRPPRQDGKRDASNLNKYDKRKTSSKRRKRRSPRRRSSN